MKKYLIILIFLSGVTVKSQTNNFVGSYWHTEMEYAEQMHILKPHRFSWQAVYGNVNQDSRGKWDVKNDTIHLIFDRLPSKKRPEELKAVLTDAGDLKIINNLGKNSKKKAVLERFDKTLPPEKAAELAKPIDYKKLRTQAKKRKEKRLKEQREEEKKEKLRYGRYDGYFENTEKTMAISLYGRENQFVGKIPDSRKKGKSIYFRGAFQIKNDTVYATTYSDQDEIKVFGNRIKTVPEGKINVYLRNLALKVIQVKIGNTYSSADFIPSAKFKKENDSLNSIQLKKADSLWVAVGEKKPIVYDFGIKRMKSNSILVQPNPKNIETWVDKPIYVSKKNEIFSLFTTNGTLYQKPGKRIPSPIGMAPTYPTFNGKSYYSIQRDQIFKGSKSKK